MDRLQLFGNMPSGSIEDEVRTGFGSDGFGNSLEMDLHYGGVAGGKNRSGAGAKL